MKPAKLWWLLPLVIVLYEILYIMEKYAWLIVRSILAVIAVLFVIYGIAVVQPCDIDAVFLSCRLNGSVGDIVGCIMFVGGMLVMSGVFKGVKHLYNPPNTSFWNLVAFGTMVLGVVIFWNL